YGAVLCHSPLPTAVEGLLYTYFYYRNNLRSKWLKNFLVSPMLQAYTSIASLCQKSSPTCCLLEPQIGLLRTKMRIRRQYLGGCETPPLLDHLVRLEEQRRRDREVQGLCGLEINDQLKLHGLLNREVSRLGAFQYPVHVTRDVPPQCK